jgi:hypothetical protein
MKIATNYKLQVIRLAFLLLFIGSGSLYAQFRMGNTLAPLSGSLYPIIYSNDAKGGFHQVATIADRNAIPILRREQGMLCTVLNADSGTPKTYQLIGGILDTNWVEFAAGSADAAAAAVTIGITNDVATATAVYPTWVTANTGNLSQYVSSTLLKFVPSTGILTATGFAGDGSALTNITATTNANLTGAVTSVGNVTSLGSFSSDNLSGALSDKTGTGVAVFANTPTLVSPNIGAATGTSLSVSGSLTSTVATGTAPLVVSSTTPVANLNIGGNAATATTATTATNATNTAITNDVATATAVYPTWVTANTGNLPHYVSSTLLKFVPSTGILTATGFAGNGSALTNITATTNANLTGAVTSVGNVTSLGSFSSANLSGALSDETGTGVAVFANAPTLVSPNIGAATGTSLSVSGSLTSTVATGTAPLVVSSTTPVANLSIGGNAATATIASTVTTNANMTGDITSVGNTTTITDKAVTLSKMNDIATARILGRNTAGTGSPEALDAATVKAMLNIADNVSFNIDRPITLSGNNNTGKNLGSGGKTMSQFFEAFFFPSVAATPPTNTFTTTTIPLTVPYSTWKNWSGVGNPPSKNIDFSWSVTNNSLTDNSDDKAITSIKLKSGVTELATATPDGSITQSGVFSTIPFANVYAPTSDFSKTYTLEVIDAQPNTVLSNITLTMSKAIQLTYGAPTVATTLYEYKNTDESVNVSWSITPNDEIVTAISVDGASAGSTASTGTKAVVLQSVTTGGPVSRTYPLIVTGSIYGAGTSKNTSTVSWANRLYRGAITSSVPPSDGSFSFTDTQIKALSSETKLGGDWKATAGYDFVCGAGGQYVCFAYPDDAATPTVQYYDSNFSSWMTYSAADVTVINRSNFSNQFGYTGTNYKLVFINVQYISATVKIRLQ